MNFLPNYTKTGPKCRSAQKQIKIRQKIVKNVKENRGKTNMCGRFLDKSVEFAKIVSDFL